IAVRAAVPLSVGTSTRTTSGLACCIRRTIGSVAAMGRFAAAWTMWATLVPSTNTCSTARCSLSVATTTTESSGISNHHSLNQDQLQNWWHVNQRDLCELVSSPGGLVIKLVFVQEGLRIFWQGWWLRCW